MEDFGRMFKMYNELCKKESSTNDKLIRALERCDELVSENEKLKAELAEAFYNDL